MEKFRQLFKGAEDPRTSNATCHDFVEMLMIALFSGLCGGRTCVDMATARSTTRGFYANSCV